MGRFSNLFLILIFVSIHSATFAQKENSTKVFHASPYNFGWKHEIPFVAVSLGFLTTGYVLDKTNNVSPFTLEELNNLNKNDVNGFDRGAINNWSEQLATTSDALLIASMVTPALFLTTKSTRKDFGWLLLMGWEVMSINYGITNTVKNLTNRTRPYVYNPDLPYETRSDHDSRKALFSGHTSTTAAMSFYIATVINTYHPDMKTGAKIGLWSAAALYPAVTAYLRVASGKHFPTDVIAGYAAGAFTGWLIPYLHKKRKKKDKFSFAPININGNAGVYLSYKF